MLNSKLSLFIKSQFWGNSPAVDLHKLLPEGREFLISGAGDCRHLLATWAGNYGEGEYSNFTVVSPTMEMIARHMLLLSIAMDSSRLVEERLNFFLEIHGNCLLQEKTNKYLKHICTHLVEMVTEESGPLINVFDISRLRGIERDLLVVIFEFWASELEFDIEKMWNTRMRNWYGIRYDHRRNLMDWDYVTRLKPVASIIHAYHYKRWCEIGNAFEIRNCTYSVPNRTLSSRCEGRDKSRRQPVSVRGYWSDIVNPPYISFGIKGNDKDLFRIQSNQHRWTSVDVCQSNVKKLLWSIAARSGAVSGPIEPVRDFSEGADDKLGQDVEEEASHKEEIDCTEKRHVPEVNFDAIAPTIPGVVTFICGGLGEKIFRKSAMRGKFDLLMFGIFHWDGIDENAKQLVRSSESIVLLETARYIITLSDKEKIKAVETAREKCRDLGWTLEKDVSEPPKVPVGQMDREIYWLDDEDTLDAYMVWKATTSQIKETIAKKLEA